MVSQILATKIYLPRVGRSLVARPQLVARLNAGLERPLTLLSAQAGFGKTTLVVNWLRDLGEPVAWVSLEESDNDPTVFMRYLIAALGRSEPRVIEVIAPLLSSTPPTPLPVIMGELINILSDGERRLILALDDYHVIHDLAIHRALNMLVEHMPPLLHLIILSREDPPLPLPRLRARDELNEIRSADLRFSAAEAAAFLNRVMGLDLAPAALAALEARTEGWIAGLQLVALSMRGLDDTASFVNAFSGSHRFILDYLSDEVLNRLSAETQRFMLYTSILDRLSGPLCDAVMAAAAGGSQEMLETLERANLFVVALDNERRWYRYHHLFAEVLGNRLQRAYADDVPDLHRRASEWYEQQGSVAPAINHALAAGLFERAAELIEGGTFPLILRAEVSTVQGWIDALPAALREGRPRLLVLQCHLAMARGQYGLVEPLLTRATALANDPISAGEVAATVAILYGLISDHRAVAAGQQALAMLPPDQHLLRALVRLGQGWAYIGAEQLAAAADALTDALAIRTYAPDVLIGEISALVGLSSVRRVQGRLREAAQHSLASLQLAAPGGHPLPTASASAAFLYWGMVLYERMELAESEAAMRRAMEIGRPLQDETATILAPTWLASVLSQLGKHAEAIQTIDGALELLRKIRRESNRIHSTEATRARIYLNAGQPELAITWADRYAADVATATTLPPSAMTLARILVTLGRLELAANLLPQIVGEARATGHGTALMKSLISTSLLYQAQGHAAQARAALREAIEIAAPEGYIRMFAEEGAPIVDLLRAIRPQVSDPAFVDRLIEASGDSAPAVVPPPRAGATPGLVEPLTDRELDVLRLLAAGLSAPEIANELIVGVSTVRTHLKNAYSKLDVHSRDQAIAALKGLHLL